MESNEEKMRQAIERCEKAAAGCAQRRRELAAMVDREVRQRHPGRGKPSPKAFEVATDIRVTNDPEWRLHAATDDLWRQRAIMYGIAALVERELT